MGTNIIAKQISKTQGKTGRFIKKLFLSLLLLPFLITPLFGETIRPVVSPVVYDAVWSVTAYGGAETDTAFEFDLTSTATIDTWFSKHGGSYACTSVFNVLDFERLLKKDIPVNNIAGYGARNVTNLCLWSQDISNAAWTKFTSTVTKDTIIATAENGRIQQQVSVREGNQYVISFTASVPVGQLTGYEIQGYYASPAFTSITLSRVPTRYSVLVTSNVGETWLLYGFQDGNTSNWAQVTITDFQVEDVTGQTNQNPSAHIPTTTAAVTKYYNTDNRNTVSANVVTEAPGAPLTNTILAAFWPLTTNVIPSDEYRDFSHANWTKVNGSITAGDVTLIDGTVVADKNTFTASAGNATIIKTQYTSASGVHAGGFFVKRKTGTGTVEVCVDNGTTWVDVTTLVDSDAGWHMPQTTLPTVTNPQLGLRLVDNGDAVYLDWAQIGDGYSRVSVHPIAGGATLAPQTLITTDAAHASELIKDKQGYIISYAQLLPDDHAIKHAGIYRTADQICFPLLVFDRTNNFYTSDGTSILSLNNAMIGYSKSASYWSDSSRQLSSNGSSSIVGNYDGSWGNGFHVIGQNFNGGISKVIFGAGIKTTQAKMDAETTP